jgi:hypothetical protein
MPNYGHDIAAVPGHPGNFVNFNKYFLWGYAIFMNKELFHSRDGGRKASL